MNPDAILTRHLPAIEAEMKRVVQVPGTDQAAYYGMMHYHLGWANRALQPLESRGGKRLRPVLCLLATESVGGDPETVLPAAAAIELVHNFSLVHDDIQDKSHLRRGRPTVWDLWGAAHGINVGDGIFVLSRLAMYGLVKKGVTADRTLEAAMALDRACQSLCEGQFLDMSFEDQPRVHLDSYLRMIRGKTAALLAASTEIGALVTTQDLRLVQSLRGFGLALGMAFQIQDDILGIWGDEKVTGKSAATDIRDKKKTLPVVYAMSQTERAQVAEELSAIYEQEGPLDSTSVSDVLGLLDAVGARAQAETMSDAYYRESVQSLEAAGLGEAGEGLLHVAASLAGRQT
jgi:geranylgeranyl diphosphate synthase type I